MTDEKRNLLPDTPMFSHTGIRNKVSISLYKTSGFQSVKTSITHRYLLERLHQYDGGHRHMN